MTTHGPIARITGNAWLNYVMTNRIPRRSLTRLVGHAGIVRQTSTTTGSTIGRRLSRL